MAYPLEDVRGIVAAATPALSLPPVDCTGACSDDYCDCSGVYRVTGWSIDVPRLRELLADA